MTELDLLSHVILLSAAFLTSILSGTIGMGGGISLMAVMGQYFPLALLVPLHGIVQLSSNASRTLYSFAHLDRRIALQFAIGATIGVALASQIVVNIPDAIYKVCLGSFILFITFVKPPRLRKKLSGKWVLVGTGSGIAGMIAGATGPLIAPFYLSENMKKETLVATKAACQVFTHLFKIVAFIFLGFTVGPYLYVLLGMIFMVIVGNYIGKLLLGRINELWFFRLFKSVIVILCLRMIFIGVRSLTLS